MPPQFKKAQTLFKNGVSSPAPFPVALLPPARCRARRAEVAVQEYKEAIETFSLAISLRPDNARYYFQRGNCFRAMGAYQR